jgi:type VI secretion system VasI family protein
MQHHQQILSAAAAALLASALPAGAELPDYDSEIAIARIEAPRGPAAPTWFLVEARNHASDDTGPVALLYGLAQEGERSRPALLRVDCFEDRTSLQIDTVDLHLQLRSAAVAVRVSLDRGAYVSDSWQADADGHGFDLSQERAIAFLTALYGRRELRLALVRPLSVPFLFTFAVSGAEQALGTLAERCHWSNGPSLSDAVR